MRINSEKVIKILEQFAPQRMAQSWDNVGFQIGNPRRQVDKVMVALEVTDAVIDEAIDQSVDLIITHHPLLFSPLKRIVEGDPVGGMVLRLIENRINLIAAHTNLDSSSLGTNAYLAERLGLERLSNLTDAYQEKWIKLVLYVPEENQETMVEVLERAGAGQVGLYSGCTFSTGGTGTFRPLEGSDSYIGSVDALERVSEVRIETLVSQASAQEVLEKALKVHPYEEPAYDLIPLENVINPPNLGLIGYLEKPESIETFAQSLKTMLDAHSMRVVRGGKDKVMKVALCTGAGADFVTVAANKKADVYITGDLKYHEAQTAKALGINVIDAGHYETEQFYVQELFRILTERFEQADYDARIVQSTANINPFEAV